MNATPDPVQMPIIGFKTGRTPAHRNKADVDKFFQERCDNCLGMFYGQVVPDPDIRSTTKDNRIRRKCFFCNGRTDMFCFKCRRWLCFSRPLKKDKKQPKYFTVNTPVPDRLGKLQPTQEDSELEYESAKEVGIWTCYHLHTSKDGPSMHNRRRVVCSTLQEFAHGFSLHERVNDKQEQCLPLAQRPECLLVSMAPDCNSVVCQGGGETYHKLAKYS